MSMCHMCTWVCVQVPVCACGYPGICIMWGCTSKEVYGWGCGYMVGCIYWCVIVYE